MAGKNDKSSSIFRVVRGIRGSAIIVSVIFATLCFLMLIGFLGKDKASKALRVKGSKQDMQLMSAHSVMALFKKELATNYTAFQTSTTWAACNKTGNLANFLSVLNNPGDTSTSNPNRASNPTNCPSVNFNLTYLQTAAGASSFPLSQVKTIVLNPINPVGLFTHNLQITNIVNNARFLVEGLLSVQPETQLQTTRRDLADVLTIRTVVDVARTTATAPGDTACHLCRTVPGSVCCTDSVQLAYLENGTGRIMDFTYDDVQQTKSVSLDAATANPAAITIKNLNYPSPVTRTDYGPSSFCIPTLQSTPMQYIIDTAQAGGINYYLTVDGRILQEGILIASPLIYSSIAFDDSAALWYLLRIADGAVFRTTTLSDPTTYSLVPNLYLPTAQKLVFGKGPSITAPCF